MALTYNITAPLILTLRFQGGEDLLNHPNSAPYYLAMRSSRDKRLSMHFLLKNMDMSYYLGEKHGHALTFRKFILAQRWRYYSCGMKGTGLSPVPSYFNYFSHIFPLFIPYSFLSFFLLSSFFFRFLSLSGNLFLMDIENYERSILNGKFWNLNYII